MPTEPNQLTGRQQQVRADLSRLITTEGFRHLTIDDLAYRLGCSKRTLYALATTKEDLATQVVKDYFKTATARVEAAIAQVSSADRRLTSYLIAVSEALSSVSRRFLTDIAQFSATREIYRANTDWAAQRVRQLITEGTEAGTFNRVNAQFVAEIVTNTMKDIGSGQMQRRTGLTDSDSYRQLATLVLAALQRGPRMGQNQSRSLSG